MYWRAIDFTDKSLTSLIAAYISCYPLHITVMNFSEESRRDKIVSRKTVAV